MNAPKKVYVVTSGEYSSFCIVAIFDDRGLAELCAARGDDADIKEYLLNPGADGLRAGLNAYLVHVDLDGTMRYDPFSCDVVDEREGWTFSDGGAAVCFRLWARDEEHARKIAGERWARLKHDGALG